MSSRIWNTVEERNTFAYLLQCLDGMISDREHRVDEINIGVLNDSEDDTSEYSLEISSSENDFSSIGSSTVDDTNNDSGISSVSSLSSNDEAFISAEEFFHRIIPYCKQQKLLFHMV